MPAPPVAQLLPVLMQGFLAFPLCLPGTAVWRGKRGRMYILTVLERAARASKAAMEVRSSSVI